jgi:hypothetical protein
LLPHDAYVLESKGGVRFPIVTYNGRWLFTGDPEDVEIFDSTDARPGLDPPTSYEDDMEVVLPSDYEDEFEYYDADVENGDDPIRGWRATPDPETFNPILKALVKASLAMPQLEHLRAQTAPLGVEGNEMEIEYVAPGRPAEAIPCDQQDGAMLGKRRWVVSVPGVTDWKIPESVRGLMQERAREVIVYGWEDGKFLN